MSNKLLEIEQAINSLSLDEQKWLLNRLTEKIKQKLTQIIAESNIDNQIELMANNPDIQREIGLINQELIITEMDIIA
ncbi:hypothetical protein AFK68_03590 [Hydrocoleum sp. CS-953]|uniref:hypothetical protein n=1 Tax=Hydrocoleum sp. CS-953 TaxID=1671698 RepID=UPI000BCF5C48|nr:hypothetical protein [Hydrocoleum sp. CS-953]OZH55592.1 hypothetical protein AFK68_03590 [Hydrocoleum sp. CS-953]